MKELKETIDLMTSKDYKERFVAEYWQTKIRYEKLKAFCDKIEASEIYDCAEDVKHDCPLALLRKQQEQMGHYLHTLEIRAVIERIDLEKEKQNNVD